MNDEIIISLYNNGESTRTIASKINMSQGYVSKIIKKYGISRNLSDARKIAKDKNRVNYNTIANNFPTEPWNKGKIKVQISSRKGKKYTEISGTKHWNWQGGISSEQHKRYSLEGKEWRRNIFSRDNFTCKICGKKGGKLHAHHIKPFSKFKDLRFINDNGITVCVDCHKEIHKTIRKIEKREELLEHPKDQIATAQFERIIAIAEKAFDINGQSAAELIRNGEKVQRLVDESRTDSNSTKSIPQSNE